MSSKASKRYEKLCKNRDNYLKRAEDAASITIPQLYTGNYDKESDGNTYGNPYQSLGARGVNNLANKIILTLFPPATAFFKMGMNPITLKNMKKGQGEIDQALQVLEKSIVNEMETSQLRASLVDLLKQCIVGGSSILHVPKVENPKVIPMQNFGISRSRSKRILELIIKECLVYSELDKETKEQIEKSNELTEEQRKDKKPIDVYTVVKREDDGMYKEHQEILGMEVDGTHGTYKEKDLPYVFVPFVDRGEDYGRSYVEDFMGDLNSYDSIPS